MLYEAIAVPDADALFLVLEYLSGGVLMEVAMGPAAVEAKAPFDTWQTREYFRQLCLGLEYLHANGVVHRDVRILVHDQAQTDSPDQARKHPLIL